MAPVEGAPLALHQQRQRQLAATGNLLPPPTRHGLSGRPATGQPVWCACESVGARSIAGRWRPINQAKVGRRWKVTWDGIGISRVGPASARDRRRSLARPRARSQLLTRRNKTCDLNHCQQPSKRTSISARLSLVCSADFSPADTWNRVAIKLADGGRRRRRRRPGRVDCERLMIWSSR